MINKQTLVAGLVLSSSLVLPAAANAQTHKVKHIKAKSIAAGIAAYEVAKHTGRPGHKNIAQRHPVLTGIAAGMAMKHHLKKKSH